MPSHSSLSRQGRENHIEIIPSPLMGEGVKKWEFAPSSYHLPVREMVNPLKLIPEKSVKVMFSLMRKIRDTL
jgi:hypothetical protein